MNPPDPFERVVMSLQEAALGKARWSEAALLINEISGTSGSALAFADGRAQADAHFLFMQLCQDGQRREDLEREYFSQYWARDESIPRIGRLPDGALASTAELYTDREKKLSPAYTEARRRTGMQNGLNVRLDGPGGSSIVLSLADSLEPGGWSSSQLATVRRLLPHVRQFVRVRKTLTDAGALGRSLIALLDESRCSVIQLDRNARIIAANDRASRLLREAEVLSDRGGFLSATTPRDNGELQQLLAQALPRLGGPGSSGSMTIKRSSSRTNVVVHVTPVAARQRDFRARQVAALVLVADPERRPSIDARLVQAALDLTPAESRLAVMVAAGQHTRDIAARTGRSEGTVRWHIQNIFRKQGISGQADLVRRVLSLEGFPDFSP